jgi:ABC-2 type transport system ATP-binding protein
VLILDEPTATVDPIASYELIETLKAVASERDRSVLISSHRLDEIEALGEHVILLDGGAIKYDGDLDTLRGLWSRPRVIMEFRSREAARAAAKALSAGDIVELDVQEDMAVGGLLFGDATIGDAVAALPRDVASSILSVREDAMPLRDLLAHVYRGDR